MPVSNPCELLKRLLSEGREKPWLEFKHNCVDVKDVGSYVSALANSAVLHDKDRAFLVYGIADQTLKPIGTTFRPTAAKIGNDKLRNWLTHSIRPNLNIEFHEFECEGRQHAIIEIEPSYQQPVKSEGDAYIRIGEHKKKLSGNPEYERSLWLATGRRKFENAIAHANVSRGELLNLLAWQDYYQLTKLTPPQNSDLAVRLFTDRKFLIDELDGTFAITNLGALLWAKDIRDFPSVSRKTIRVIKYIGNDVANAEAEREGRLGYALGYSGLTEFVKSQVSKREAIAAGVRNSIPIIPDIATRELISNAMIHQDLTAQGSGPIIEIFDNRVEISNPGAPLGDIERLIDDAPRSRNELLAKSMRDLGLCEERGKGLDKALAAIEDLAVSENIHLPAPSFRATDHGFVATLFSPKAFKALSKEERLRSCYQHCVLSYLKGDYMNNTSLRRRFSLKDDDYQAASSVITEAVRGGIIAPADDQQGKRNARYIPVWAK
jgi:ATP-dependent DNA helicase RecG